MKVYLASRFSTLLEMRTKAEELAALGIECTSTWLTEKSDPNIQMNDASLTDSFLLHTAIVDIKDIRRSDAVVLFTVDPTQATVRGGRHFESGFAYGQGVPLIVCGPRENIFHYLPDVAVFDNFELVKQELLKRDYSSVNRYYDKCSQPAIGYSSAGLCGTTPGTAPTVYIGR